MSGLSDFQVDVARCFFDLPASDGFLLAGGGALLVSGLTTRPTRDLDFFGAPTIADVTQVCEQFEAAVTKVGWSSSRLQSSDSFIRLHIVGPEELIVEIAIDSAARWAPVLSVVGPTFDPQELAGRKLVALFSRAEARDFADVYALAQQFDKAELLEWAREIDPGFDLGVLRDMFGTLNRFTDDEIPIDPSLVARVRAFFESWTDDMPTSRTEKLLTLTATRQLERVAVHWRNTHPNTAFP